MGILGPFVSNSSLLVKINSYDQTLCVCVYEISNEFSDKTSLTFTDFNGGTIFPLPFSSKICHLANVDNIGLFVC